MFLTHWSSSTCLLNLGFGPKQCPPERSSVCLTPKLRSDKVGRPKKPADLLRFFSASPAGATRARCLDTLLRAATN